MFGEKILAEYELDLKIYPNALGNFILKKNAFRN